ncbi:TPA: hypothetical protein IGZ65_004825 [Escherichia coli]|nr:hypothetical protein [Escherichia coli]
MNETELKHVIALLLEDVKRFNQLQPNTGTEARIWMALYAIESGDDDDEAEMERRDGVNSSQPQERWTIDFIEGDRFLFRRELNGERNESYRIVERDVAAVYAAAIINGFEPPRILKEKDSRFI